MAEPVNIDQQQLQTGFDLAPDKRLYFNGFTVGILPMDFAIVLLYNNEPIAYLSTSHTIAKSMAGSMNDLIKDFEGKTGQPVLMLHELQALLEKDTP